MTGPIQASEKAASAADPPAELFARLPPIAQAELSPDGARLATLRAVEGRYRAVVHTLDEGRLAAGARLELGEAVSDVVGIDWSGSRYLLISALVRRPLQPAPSSRVFVFDARQRDLAPLVPAPNKGGHSLRAKRASKNRQPAVRLVDSLPMVETKALAVVNEPDERGSEVWRVDLASGGYDRVLRDGQSPLSMRADPAGRLRLRYSAPEGEPEIAYRTGSDAQWRSMTPPLDPDAGDRIAGLAGTGDAIWVLRPADGCGRRLYRFDPATKRFSEPIFGPTERDVERILTQERAERRRLLGYRAAGHFREDIYLRDAWKARKKRIDEQLPESVNTIVSSDRGERLHVVRARRADRPTRYFLYDADADRVTRLASTHPALAKADLPGKRPVAYRARDGTSIPAFLTLPKTGEPPFPSVVLVHGGPTSRVYQNFHYWTQFLASRGYAVLEPNFRGSDGYGQAWEDAGRLEWGGLIQRDIADGARWLRETRIADGERLCIMGGSFGGYAALMGAAKSPKRYACAVAVNAVSDLERMVREDRERFPGAPWTRFVGLGGAGEARLKKASPISRVEEIAAPVLLLHARDDLRVSPRHSRQMAEALKEADKTVELVIAEDGGHPLNTGKARRALLSALEAFLARHLRTGEAAEAS